MYLERALGMKGYSASAPFAAVAFQSLCSAASVCAQVAHLLEAHYAPSLHTSSAKLLTKPGVIADEVKFLSPFWDLVWPAKTIAGLDSSVNMASGIIQPLGCFGSSQLINKAQIKDFAQL